MSKEQTKNFEDAIVAQEARQGLKLTATEWQLLRNRFVMEVAGASSGE